MRYTIIKAENIEIASWSGGTTSELFIHPPESTFKKRNFDFRLSTATVEVDSSFFTPLPGIDRTLMVLDGELSLHHQSHHKSSLKKFDQDSFSGGWETSSKGQCVDFNLMSMGKVRGKIKSYQSEIARELKLILGDGFDFSILYIHKGGVEVRLNEKVELLKGGDVLVLRSGDYLRLNVSSEGGYELILSQIKTS